MKHRLLSGVTGLLLLFSMTGCGGGSSKTPTGPVGWAIGDDPNGTAVILHTQNGGRDWHVQGHTFLWTGHSSNDISAVDRQTAWAALGSFEITGGVVLRTTNGGVTWDVRIPLGVVPSGVKGIKGISPCEAWAVGLEGPVLHTLDGGRTWAVVPTDGLTFRQVNRMDVLGSDIWIADYGNGEVGMVHSADYGRTWRREYLPSVTPGDGPMTISIVNSQVAWTTINAQGDVYRTQDGGTTWSVDAPDVSGADDIDDLCAVGPNEVWAVQNLGGFSGGHVMRITIAGSEVSTRGWNFGDYAYEGVSAFDGSTAWIVGFKTLGVNRGLPDGSILHTTDGETWTSQPIPVSDVRLWKVSFVGARR